MKLTYGFDMSQSFKDLFSQQAQDYQKFRPTYPPELFSYLASLPGQKKFAVDCGTGNGQAAVELAAHFEKVLGVDPSQKQIDNAVPHPRVGYQVSAAEKLPVADHSVDLLTVAQAFHWFKHELFFQETRRVLKEQGILAIWIYGLCRISPEIDAAVMELYEGILGPYWEPERKLLEQNFETISFPFVELPGAHFQMEKTWDFETLVGYLGTWSSLQTYRQKTGQDPLLEWKQKNAKLWGSDVQRKIVWDISPRIFSSSLKK